MFTINVVCTGNICRSPMGETVLRERLNDAGITVTVLSSGVSAEENGHPIDPRAARTLNAEGYSVPVGHRAHRATDAELRDADLVLAMTTGHARSLRARMEAAGIDTTKLHLWREFDGTTPVAPAGAFGPGGPLENATLGQRSRFADFYTSDGKLDVPDPWYGDEADFIDTLKTVEAGADGIVEWLRTQRLGG